MDCSFNLIVFGLVGPIGCDKTKIYKFCEDKKGVYGYEFNKPIILKKHLEEILDKTQTEDTIKNYSIDYYEKLMSVANNLRDNTNKTIMSNLAISEILKDIFEKIKNQNPISKTQVYVISSLKYKEDIEELKRVFGLNFFIIGCCSLKKTELKEEEKETEKAKELFKKDKILKVFEKSDFFVDLDDPSFETHMSRFFNLILSDLFWTPNQDELFMSLAYNVASRSASLSRQIGAVLVSEHGDILSVGCNEVPKKGGGQYWNCDSNDAREFKIIKEKNLKSDSNKMEINKIKNYIKDYILKISPTVELKNIEAMFDKSGINDSIECFREEHAEEEAIVACARNGHVTRKSILYSTTFPCHLCTKKIVAAGIEKVIYIEPYPKSKFHLFEDSVILNDDLTGSTRTDDSTRVVFEQFKGVGPSRYLDLFSLNLSKGHRLERDVSQLNQDKQQYNNPRMYKNNFINLLIKFFENNKTIQINQNISHEETILVNFLNHDIKSLENIFQFIETSFRRSVEETDTQFPAE